MLRSIFLALAATVALSTFASAPASAGHERTCSYCYHVDDYGNRYRSVPYDPYDRQYGGNYHRRHGRYRHRSHRQHGGNSWIAPFAIGTIFGIIAGQANRPQPQPVAVYRQSIPVVRAVPTGPVFQATDGRYCREYQSTATIGGQSQQTYGMACRQPDGSWQIVQ